MTDISRNDLPSDYSEMMESETHHDHVIIKVDGVIRWKENQDVKHILKSMSLNHLCPLLDIIGHGKNSEAYRSLYRNMGYSLSGYWEIFYWDMNNDDANEYRQPIAIPTGYTLIKTELFDKAIVAAVYDNEWNDNAGVYECRDCSMSAEYCSNIEHKDSCLVVALKAEKESSCP